MSYDHDHQRKNAHRSDARSPLTRVALVAAAILLIGELWFAPMVVIISAAAAGSALAWLQRPSLRARRRAEAVPNKNIQIITLLLAGLWAGVYIVFAIADSNVDSSIRSTVPIRFDGESVSSASLIAHGMVTTAGVLFAMVGVRPTKLRRHRRRSLASSIDSQAETLENQPS